MSIFQPMSEPIYGRGYHSAFAEGRLTLAYWLSDRSVLWFNSDYAQSSWYGAVCWTKNVKFSSRPIVDVLAELGEYVIPKFPAINLQ